MDLSVDLRGVAALATEVERGRNGCLEDWIGEEEALGMREFWSGELLVTD